MMAVTHGCCSLFEGRKIEQNPIDSVAKHCENRHYQSCQRHLLFENGPRYTRGISNDMGIPTEQMGDFEEERVARPAAGVTKAGDIVNEQMARTESGGKAKEMRTGVNDGLQNGLMQVDLIQC